MSTDFVINAKPRAEKGRGASRRLRRQGFVPGIIYGGHGEPVQISVPASELDSSLEYEGFYSHILTIKLDGNEEQVILKDLQRHPAKTKIWHLDLQRVVAGEAITVNVPLHFTGGEESPGVHLHEGVIEHHLNDVEVNCLPKDLPEYIEIDLSAMDINDAIHLSEIKLPEGVTSVDLAHEHDYVVVSVNLPRVVEEPEEEEVAEGEEPEAEGEEGETEEGDQEESDDRKED